MTSLDRALGSKLRKAKPRLMSSELADQFQELQRLREEVRELEQANDSQKAGRKAWADLAGCQK